MTSAIQQSSNMNCRHVHFHKLILCSDLKRHTLREKPLSELPMGSPVDDFLTAATRARIGRGSQLFDAPTTQRVSILRLRLDDRHDFQRPRIHDHNLLADHEILIAAPPRFDCNNARRKSRNPYVTRYSRSDRQVKVYAGYARSASFIHDHLVNLRALLRGDVDVCIASRPSCALTSRCAILFVTFRRCSVLFRLVLLGRPRRLPSRAVLFGLVLFGCPRRLAGRTVLFRLVLFGCPRRLAGRTVLFRLVLVFRLVLLGRPRRLTGCLAAAPALRCLARAATRSFAVGVRCSSILMLLRPGGMLRARRCYFLSRRTAWGLLLRHGNAHSSNQRNCRARYQHPGPIHFILLRSLVSFSPLLRAPLRSFTPWATPAVVG